jgi:hypothetical protein
MEMLEDDEVSELDGKSLKIVEQMIDQIREKVKQGTCADLTRLIQLRKELREAQEKGQIRRIEVQWVRPGAEFFEDD